MVIEYLFITLLAGYAGRLSDQKDNRNLILISKFISMVGMLMLYSTSMLGHPSLFVIAFLLFGLAGVISMPSQNKIAILAVLKKKRVSIWDYFKWCNLVQELLLLSV